MSEREDEVLLHLAKSVADGTPVDWQSASMSGEASVQRIKRLQILASIAAAHGMPADMPPRGEAPRRWGHLEVRDLIGEGVFGEVFRAWETTLEREVAVKFLRAGAAPLAAHVLQEGRNLAKVRHPGVVTVYGAEQLDDRVGIWMELVRGRTLEDLLQEHGPFDEREALQIGVDLCRALAAVHEAGLVHRDVKTRNVMRADDGRIVLMDFGTGAEMQVHTGAPAFAGTPIYLAPEVLRGEPASAQSDLYGLGVLLYRLVTGEYPITGGDLEALRGAHERDERRPLRTDLPVEFRRVVGRALAPVPAQRFATAADMEAALLEALESPRRAARRRTRIIALAAAAAVVATVAFVVSRPRQPTPTSPGARPLLAIADIINETKDPDFDALASLLGISLDQSRSFSVLSRSRMQDVLESLRRPAAERIDRRLGVAICRQAGAAALLIPRITTTRNEVVLEVAGVEPRRDREIFHVRSAAAGKSGIHAALDSLAARVRIALHEEAAAIPSQSRPTAQITTASLAAYRDYDRAEACIDRIEMEPARRHLEAAIGIDSTFGLAHGRLAYVLWWLDDSRGERAHLARAFALIDRIPERQRYHVRAQGAMADRQGLEAARSILLEMERFYPDDKEMLFGIGDYSSHLSDYPTAIAYLEKVVTMDANHPRAVQHLARVYRDLGRAAPFLEWSRRNAVLDSVADAAELLGSAQVLAGDTPAGIATLEHGWRRAPSNQGFVAALASAYSHAGRFAEAIQVLESNSDAPRFMHRQRAGVHVQRGGVEAALRDLATAAAIALQENDPADAAVNEIAAALILMLMKDDAPAALACVARSSTAAAAITYRDAYFSYWPYWGGLFKLHLLNRDLEAATALAQERFGADKWYGPYVTTYLHAAKGECEQAAAAASRILEWGPAAENLELYYFLARCQADQGDAEAAMESLRKMAALDSHLNAGTPVLTKGVLLLSELCERNGDPRQAASLCAKLLDRWAQADRDLPDRRAAEQRLARVAKPAVSPAR